jgi:putative glutamate/gamma-aminobutyrate antiporter
VNILLLMAIPMDISNKASSGKILSVFGLTMINVIAVDSLRTLTAGAIYGFSLVFFYLIIALFFFVPSILVSAELATGWPTTGGAYIWVREAFGARLGFFAIWLQWIYNVVWYPTIFSFIAATLAYLIHPELANSNLYMLSAILIMFWGATFINCLGIKAASWVSILSALLGTLVPMVFIILLGSWWIGSGKPTPIHFSLQNFFPNLGDLNNLAFLSTILFGLMGMEMSAVHAGDVRNPASDYPRALTYSGVIILFSLMLASLAIPIVVPGKEISLVSGLIDAYAIFFKAANLSGFIPVIAAMIVFGSLGCAAAWLIGPTRGLLVASRDGHLPKIFQKTNRKSMPVNILLLQGVIFTILCSVFLLMPSVNSSYWLLSDLTAQLALLFYILLFSAAIRLRYKHPNAKRAYKIPGGNFGMWLTGSAGIFTCVVAIAFGFLPPTQVPIGNLFTYECLLTAGMIIFCAPPFAFYAWCNRKKK